MANFYQSNATGNWSTAATWAKSSSAIGTPTLHATTNLTPTTSGIFSAAFTAPNITGNKSVGCIIFCATLAGTGNWIATLQEDSGGGFVDTTATATISHANLVVNNWLYFQWGTPYAYAVATANKYRIKLSVSVATSGNAAADGGGTTVATIEFNNIGGPPVLGDRVFISPPNQTGTIAVTVTGTTSACGDAAELSTSLLLQRAITNSVTVSGITVSGGEGVLNWDTTANATLTIRGPFVRSQGGEWQMGTVATPMPAGIVATLIYDNNGTEGLAGGRAFVGSRRILQGAPSPNTTDWKRTYASGSGTTGSPLVISAGAAFSVNDHIVVSNQTFATVEYRFIKTVIDSQTYTLSTTAGGVEAGLSQTHQTTDVVLNIGRNVVIKSNAQAQGWSDQNQSIGIAVLADNNVAWARFEWAGTAVSSKEGFAITRVNGSVGSCDYSVSWQQRHRAISAINDRTPQTHTGLIAVGDNSSATSNLGALNFNTVVNKTLVDCYAIGQRCGGFELLVASLLTLTRCVGISNNGASAASGGNFMVSGLVFSTLTNCESHGATARGMGINTSGMSSCTFNNYVSGTKGTNTIDIALINTGTFATGVFHNAVLGSATPVSGYIANLVAGSLIAFDTLNNTTNNNIWYTNYGTAQATGSGLGDTNVRTPGSLAVRIAPEEATTGFSWSFFIPAPAGQVINFYGWFQLNAAFTGDAAAAARVELWLPGASSATATATIPKTTNAWQAISLIADNSAATISGLATVYVYGLTTTASAYLYADDFYNAGDGVTNTDKVTGLDIWANGQPDPVITPSATSPAAIWTYDTSLITSPALAGARLNKALSTAKFIGLK